jgi:predicted Zn-dependent peptidase
MPATKHTFSNGIRLITQPMPQVNSVSIIIMVGAGARYEQDDQRGVAHFVEHMLFQGTENWPTEHAINLAVDELGAAIQAITHLEYSYYAIKAAYDALAPSVEILADLVRRPLLAPQRVEVERAVILEEIRESKDDPAELASLLADSMLYGEDSPLGRPTWGSEESVRRLAHADLVRFYQDMYTADNIVLSVAGRFEEPALVDLVGRYFGDMNGTRRRRFAPWTGPGRGPRALARQKPSTQTYMRLGVPAYPIGHPKEHALVLLNTILGASMASRLYTRIRSEHGLVYDIFSSTEHFSDAGSLSIFAGTAAKNALRVLELILRELDDLRRNGVTDEEVRRAKRYCIGTWRLSLDDPSFIAFGYVLDELIRGRIEEPEEFARKIEAVTTDEVNDVAAELFTGENLKLAAVGRLRSASPLLEVMREYFG